MLGLDGFSKGWVAVLLDGDVQEISFHHDVTDALSRPFDRAGIDIPIGMMDEGERDCDLLARAKLRPHTSRVFTGARRWLWQQFSDPDAANPEALRRGQKRVSRQSISRYQRGASRAGVSALERQRTVAVKEVRRGS